jgi:hypothetical protein
MAENLPGEVSDTPKLPNFQLKYPPRVTSLLTEKYSSQRKEAFWVCKQLTETNKQTYLSMYVCYRFRNILIYYFHKKDSS